MWRCIRCADGTREPASTLCGSLPHRPSARHALPLAQLLALRRRALAAHGLKTWLERVTADLDPSHAANLEFGKIKSQYSALSEGRRAREQVAGVYKRWLDLIASSPKAGRSMALFQDLSAAYALERV